MEGEKTASEHRRALHRIPEEGNREFKTHEYILGELRRLGFDRIETYSTGIRAVLDTGADVTTAFRADMDALPISERTGLEFASEHPGRMHACGHDGHMAVLLRLAARLVERREGLKRNVVLIFQPAEESVGGALPMIEAGALKNPDVDEIYGLHIMPDVPLGKAALRDGPMLAQTCEFDIDIRGISAHGASPHLGADAIAAASYCVGAFQEALARRVDPSQPSLLTVGKIEGGIRRNILASHVRLECISRCFSDRHYEDMKACMLGVLAGAERVYGVEAEYTERLYYPAVVNSAQTNARLRAVLGGKAIDAAQLMIAEDFSYYQKSVNGSYMLLGTGSAGYESPLHSDTFDFDERILEDAVDIYMKLIGI